MHDAEKMLFKNSDMFILTMCNIVFHLCSHVGGQ